MRLGRKLSEGFAVDREADDAAVERPARVTEPVTPLAVEPDHYAAGWAQPVGSGRRPES